jgi:threonine dehydratase
MAAPAAQLVRVDDVAEARRLLAGVVRVTPVEGSRPLSDLVGGPVWLKCENLQRTGSFKLRGAYVRIARLAAGERARGVVAASAGNHAQGVALAASMLGCQATVFMPEGAALPKIEATEAYGAQVHLAGPSIAEAMSAATSYAEQHGAVFIHPFDHPDIIAGQGTLGAELAEQCPDARTVVVAAGGGGLVSGVATACKDRNPAVRIVAVQAAGAAAYPPSLAAGHPVALETMATIADGIAVGCPGALTFAHVQALVDDVVTVSEEALSRAMLLCLERAKLVVEPAGVAGVAAVMEQPASFEPPVAVVLSGGNVDPVLLLRLLRHGMAAAGRYLSLRLRIPDRPGELARLLGELAASGANVLDVEHLRTGPRLHLGEVEVALQLETRGPANGEDLLRRLENAGYPVEVV